MSCSSARRHCWRAIISTSAGSPMCRRSSRAFARSSPSCRTALRQSVPRRRGNTEKSSRDGHMTPRWQFGQPWARLAVGLILAFVLAVLLTNGAVPAAIRLEAALVLVVTLVRPAVGLMIVAFLAPLGDIVAPIVG